MVFVATKPWAVLVEFSLLLIYYVIHIFRFANQSTRQSLCRSANAFKLCLYAVGRKRICICVSQINLLKMCIFANRCASLLIIQLYQMGDYLKSFIELCYSENAYLCFAIKSIENSLSIEKNCSKLSQILLWSRSRCFKIFYTP